MTSSEAEFYAAGLKIGNYVVNFGKDNISPKTLQALMGDLLPQYANQQDALRSIVVKSSFLQLLDFAGTGKGIVQRDALLGDLKDVYSERTILAIRLIIDGILHVDCARKYADQADNQEEIMRFKQEMQRSAVVRWVLYIPALHLSFRLIEILLSWAFMGLARKLHQDVDTSLAYYNFFIGALTAIAVSVIISKLAPARKEFSSIIACIILILLITKDYLVLSAVAECGRAPQDSFDWHIAKSYYSHIIIPYPTCNGALFLGLGILMGVTTVFVRRNPSSRIALFMPWRRPGD